MKIVGTVRSVSSSGDYLNVIVAGKEPNAADWRLDGESSFQVVKTARNAAAFHVGRKVELTIKPKGT